MDANRAHIIGQLAFDAVMQAFKVHAPEITPEKASAAATDVGVTIRDAMTDVDDGDENTRPG